MAEFPETSDSLILRVRNPSNHGAWSEFEQLYRPVIFRIARAKGLQHADAEADALISLEYRRELLRRAADQVRSEVQEGTWLAFELTVLQRVPIEAAAQRLGLSTGSVYAARSRLMRRLRDAVR